MMKVAKLGWVRPAGQEQGWSKARVGLKHEQGPSRAGTGQEQSRAERGQGLGRNWGGARNVPDRSLKEAGQEYGRGWAEAGAGEE